MTLGFALNGITEVSESAGTWSADYYFYESWPAIPGFTPQTEITNEIERKSVQFDRTELEDGSCFRWRRIYSVMHVNYDLRPFPFDRQFLYLDVSDALYPSDYLVYADEPQVSGIDPEARTLLLSWDVGGQVDYSHTVEASLDDEDSAGYDSATFELSVTRQTSFHLTRFFLPLLIIVAVAFSVFWISPQDLGSQVGVGVTCLLAAIAFQLAQVSSLPPMGYLTFSDMVYTVCYLLIALALGESVYTNHLTLHDRRGRAEVVDRWSRWLFPAVLAIGIGVSALLKL